MRWLTIHAVELKGGRAHMAPNESSWSWRRIFCGLGVGAHALAKGVEETNLQQGQRAFKALLSWSCLNEQPQGHPSKSQPLVKLEALI